MCGLGAMPPSFEARLRKSYGGHLRMTMERP